MQYLHLFQCNIYCHTFAGERRKLDIEYFSKLLEKILEVQKNRKKLKAMAEKKPPKERKKREKGHYTCVPFSIGSLVLYPHNVFVTLSGLHFSLLVLCLSQFNNHLFPLQAGEKLGRS